MDNTAFRMEKIRSLFSWLRVFRLYRRAFPRSERKPLWVILLMWRKGKTDVWCAYTEGRFAGFATTINSSRLILLDYLAVAGRLRGQGCGTRMLREIMARYADFGLLVEIESIFGTGEGMEERLRRRQFYLRAGLKPMGVTADVFGVPMELLGRSCSIDFAAYLDFYRKNYSEYAAKHIFEIPFPDGAS